MEAVRMVTTGGHSLVLVARHPKKSARHCLGPPAMRFAFICRHAGDYPLGRMCRDLEVSPSGYYAWHHRPESQRSQEDRRSLIEIRAIHRQSRMAHRGLQESLVPAKLSTLEAR